MGISNRCYAGEIKKGVPRERYSVQFYDFDGSEPEFKRAIPTIMRIFPYDALAYKSKHGFHVLSFSLLKGYLAPIRRARMITKILNSADRMPEQDFGSFGENFEKGLALRVSSKWRKRFFRRNKIISGKPTFFGLLKSPNRYRISERHLNFYRDFMALPDWVYKKYDDCDKKNLDTFMYHYYTGD
jgi:hypothetical protein